MALSKRQKQLHRTRRRRDLSRFQALTEGLLYYECSRFATHHRHRFLVTATLCGLWQFLYHRWKKKPYYTPS